MRRTHLGTVGFAAAAALVAGTLPLATAAMASASAVPAVTVTGSVGSLPARQALVIIEAELPVGGTREPFTPPARLDDIPVATAMISGPTFRVPVPNSPLLRRIERHDLGYVEFVAIVDSGDTSTTLAVPVPMTAAATRGNAGAAAVVQARMAHLGQLPAFRPVRIAMRAVRASLRKAPMAGPGCYWTVYGRETHSETTIGEVHVAEVSNGPTDEYTYTTTDDTDVTFGISTDPSKNYTFAGTINLDNSVAASGHYLFSDTESYVDTLMYYQRYEDNGDVSDVCPDPGQIAYKNPADHSAGNVDPADAVDPGTPGPGYDPYGGCTHDPYGAFPLSAGAGWSKDHATAKTESVNGTAWGFNVGAAAGFTDETLQDYEAASGTTTTYICGDGNLPTVSVIWNTAG